MNLHDILRGRKKFIISPNGLLVPSTELELSLPKFGYKGFMRAWTTRPDLKNVVTQDTGWFPNLITDAGLNRLGTTVGMSCFHVGTGVTTPAVTDTTLASYLAGLGGIPGAITYVGGTPYIIRQTWTGQYPVGAAAGNLTEMGMSTTTTTGNLWSRARIVDGLGSPTTITVQPTEALNVAYTLEVSVDTTDVAGTCNITGSANHSTTTRPALLSSWFGGSQLVQFMQAAAVTSGNVYAGTLGTVTGNPSGVGASTTSQVAGTYSNNSLKRSITITWNQTAGNLSGGVPIQSAVLGLSGIFYQTQFSPTIAKDNTKTLVINYDVSWGR